MEIKELLWHRGVYTQYLHAELWEGWVGTCGLVLVQEEFLASPESNSYSLTNSIWSGLKKKLKKESSGTVMGPAVETSTAYIC